MYSKILAFVICVFSLTACGGPNFEEGGFTETFTVPVEKGKMAVEMLVIFSGLPSQDKTVLLYKKLKPIIANSLKEEAQDWPAVHMFGHDVYKAIDPNRSLFKNVLCERIKKSFRKEMESPTITQCLVINLEKIPDK